LSIREFDGNGLLTNIHEGNSSSTISTRKLTNSGRLGSSVEVLQSLINVFLPTGYPHSVKPDYLDYQIYDSFQAFSSSIAALFANRAVLSAVGVGDESATSTSALFMKIIQDTVGRLGTILFAWRLGSALEPECKKYRYMADLVNDAATIFDCLSPLFPGSRNFKVALLCMSGLLRSICGVMAGGSRAALTQHFTDPKRGSIADVNAKDQSQETVITLLGMLTGSVVVGIVQGDGLEMWIAVTMLLALHLYTNYQAVAHVVMRTLNRQRVNIVFSDIISSLDTIRQSAHTDVESDISISRLLLNPKKTSLKERILEGDGLLRWYDSTTPKSGSDNIIGFGRFGNFLSVVQHLPRGSTINEILEITGHHGYIISYYTLSHTGRATVQICLIHGAAKNADAKAWVHALLIAKEVIKGKSVDGLEVIRSTEKLVTEIFDELRIESALTHAGWDLDRYAIQSWPNPTFKPDNADKQ
jgi:hypothetical protein